MQQLVNIPTRGNSILDKFLVENTISENFHIPAVEPNFGNSDHLAVFLKPTSQCSSTIKLKKVYDYRGTNISAFKHVLKLQAWQLLYRSDASIDSKCEFFYKSLQTAMKCIPFSYVEMSDRDKPWMTPLIKLLINRRYDAFRQGHYSKYVHLKNKIKLEILKAKSAWLRELKKTPHGIWNAVKSVSSNPSTRPQTFAKSFYSASEVADALNAVFSSVFSPSSCIDSTLTGTSAADEERWDLENTSELVSKLLERIKGGKAAGNDHLTPRLLKAGLDVLVGPLTHLFSCSIISCKVPQKWKQAIVAPIPKVKNPSLTDFRPISLLPIPSKILESIVLDSIKSKLLNLYGPNQYGFRPGASTLDAHLATHDHVTRLLDQRDVKGVALIAMDLSKAFDRLSHSSLLQSLSPHIPPNCLLWLKDFLSGRSQRVSFGGTMSTTEINVTSGVPQGSILAPYLFAAHMGNLIAATSSTRMIKYADDVTFLIHYSDYSALSSTVQTEIQNLQDWCLASGLSINETKSKTLLFSKDSPSTSSIQDLPNIEPHLTYLGVTFEASLKWNKHVEQVTKKASRRIYALKSLKKIPSVTKRDLLQVYNNFILSVMEYNSPLMVGMSQKHNRSLDSIRKRCHRIICGAGCGCNDFPAVSDRRYARAMRFFSWTMNPKSISNSLLPPQLPRTRHFRLEPMRTTRRAKSFVPFCTKAWNSHL